MRKLFLLFIAGIFSLSLFAQTNDLVVFTEKGEEFILYVNSVKQNETPAANVKSKDISGETFMIRVVFNNKGIPELTQNFWTESKNVEISAVVMQNKKGKWVLRPMGESPKKHDASPNVTNDYVNYENPERTQPNPTSTETSVTTTTVSTERVPKETFDMNVSVSETGMNVSTDAAGETIDMNVSVSETGMIVNTNVGGEIVDVRVNADENGMSFTTTAGGETVNVDLNVSETGMDFSTGVGGESVNLNIDLSGLESMDIEMDVNENSTTTTTYTTTTTTTSTNTTNLNDNSYDSYTHESVPVTRCSYAMSAKEFEDALESINSKTFEDSKLSAAKQICKSSCMTAEQIRDLNKTFSFEETKLEFAKFAYDFVYDTSKYHRVNESFTFEMTIDELNEYLESK